MNKEKSTSGNPKTYSVNQLVAFLREVFPEAKKEELTGYLKNPSIDTSMIIYSGVCSIIFS